MPERALTCAICGKDLRESSGPRRNGGRWYCSAYCALHDEVTKSHHRATTTRSVRRRAVRTLKVALLFVVLLIAAFVATIVVESTGTSPVALGQTQTFGPWRLDVASVNWSAGGGAPPAARNITVVVAVQYQGAGEARPPFGFSVEGAHHVLYGDPDLGGPEVLPTKMFSGAHQSFRLQFTVATDDLETLRLYVQPSVFSKEAPVEFSLQSA